MKLYKIALFVCAASLFAGCTSGHKGHSEYAGEQSREIKSLSKDDVKNYREGNGMGFAKLAELNGFPGPRHILEIESELDLSPDQKQKVRDSFDSMKKEAVDLGKKIITREKQLNDLFEDEKIDSETLERSTVEIAKLQGELRNVHLRTHLSMKKVLTSEQIDKYNKLRGYKNN